MTRRSFSLDAPPTPEPAAAPARNLGGWRSPFAYARAAAVGQALLKQSTRDLVEVTSFSDTARRFVVASFSEDDL